MSDGEVTVNQELIDKIQARADVLSLAIINPVTIAQKLVEEFADSAFTSPAYWLSLSDGQTDKGLDIALFEYKKSKFSFRVGMLVGTWSYGVDFATKVYDGEVVPGKHITAYFGVGVVEPYSNMSWDTVIPVGVCTIKF